MSKFHIKSMKKLPGKIKDSFNEENMEKVGKKVKSLRPPKFSFHDFFERLQSCGGVLAAAVIATVFVMIFFCCAVFFVNLRGPEKVMVPEVRGKQLEDALIEMQAKELYPKITRRYSETPDDEGTILEQNPPAGSIVKGYSRVSLVVSRGIIVDHVENYIGQNIEDVRLRLQTLFAGSSRPLIVLENPVYRPDVSDAGTILEQEPPEGTNISEPVSVKFVVSRGPDFENTRVPNLVGNSVNDVLQVIARSRLVFDFTSHTAADGENAGTVVSQQTFEGEFVRNYTRVRVDMALPAGSDGDNVYGIFTAELTEYPYPVPMRLDAVTADGGAYTLVSFMHPGASVTLPYAVPKDTALVLYVVDKAAKKMTVR